MKFQYFALTAAAALVLGLAACGGGGSDTASLGASPGVSALAPSSGAITAFGSVFVNGHEFSTSHVSVVDDDTGGATAATSTLEVGQVVDVVPANTSTNAAPVARELHVHPLARGYVDSSNPTASTLTVMGQTVQITSATNFSDHRACLVASTNPCAAITGQAALNSTTGAGNTALPGNYVTVSGYLFQSAPAAVHIVATLISVSDVPTSTTTGANFKAEGVVNATAANSITVGGLSINLANAVCRVAGASTPCTSAFSVGQVVSSFASAAPNLPALVLTASNARLGAMVPVDTATTVVEVEGSVSSVNPNAHSFVVRGLTMDASALPAGTALPSVGDVVRVLGTLSADGQSLAVSGVTLLHAAASASMELVGDAGIVALGSSSNSFVVSVLGRSINVNANTRLADHSSRGWWNLNPVSNPFNISTFQTYLAASVSQHLVVNAQVDASGQLNAVSITLVPASTVSAVVGLVSSAPAPVNSATTGTPSVFFINGLPISVDPAAILSGRGTAVSTVAAGDQMTVIGTFSAGQLTVGPVPSATNAAIDLGAPLQRNRGGWF